MEIVRMVVRLENLFVEGASLEPTLLERRGEGHVHVCAAVFRGGRQSTRVPGGCPQDHLVIINSQSLWGDYETVPALAVYQPVRPENVKYATVISYIWNDKEKMLADQRSEGEREWNGWRSV